MKILVPIDGSSYSENALAFLSTRSELFGENPTVELLVVFDSVPGNPSECAAKRYCEEKATDIFSPALTSLAGKHVTLIKTVLIGDPAEQIAREADRLGANLIMMGSRGRTALAGLFLGSVTNGVLKQTKIPVLIIRGQSTPHSDALRVGIAVDGSHYGLSAVHHVLENRALYGTNAVFYLIHVANDYASAVYPDIFGMTLPTFSTQEIEAMQKKEFNDVMTPLLPLFTKAGITPKTSGLVGNAGDEIAAFAQNEGLDLVVMGSHGYGRIKSAVMGSTATRIASRGTVPLLVTQLAEDTDPQ